MEVESTEKIKKERRGAISSLTISNIPRSVHSKIVEYQLKISGERRKYYTVKQAYVEFLKEAAKTVTV